MSEELQIAAPQDIWFVYDGECPICQMGANLYRLRQNVGQLHVVDARTEKDHPVMREVNAAGLSLDVGMVIKYDGVLYQGDKALNIMALLGDEENIYNRMNHVLFKHQWLATVCYPFMRAARNVALCLKGSGKIRNLEGN